MFPVLSQLLTPAQALQKHCSAAASNELWPLPNVRCRQMQVSEHTALKRGLGGSQRLLPSPGMGKGGLKGRSQARVNWKMPSEVPL